MKSLQHCDMPYKVSGVLEGGGGGGGGGKVMMMMKDNNDNENDEPHVYVGRFTYGYLSNYSSCFNHHCLYLSPPDQRCHQNQTEKLTTANGS